MAGSKALGLLTVIAAAAMSSTVVHAHAKSGDAGMDDDQITVVLTGQALIHKDIRIAGPKFRATVPLLEGDAVFTNFETTVLRPGGSLDEMDPLSGTYAPPEAFDALKDMGFNLIAMANNHIYDIGEAGLIASKQEAIRHGLAHSGVGHNLGEASAPGYLHTDDGIVALVSMATGFLHGKGRATEVLPGLNELAIAGGDVSTGEGPITGDAERNLAMIREAREHADLVIVYHHNHSYDRPFIDLMLERNPDRLRPPQWVKSWARKEIDAGADLVVMHGAPFLQGVEIYRGKPIFYNLGNYIFQLKHAEHVDLFGPLAGESAVAQVRFVDRKLRGISFHPIVLDPRHVGEGPAAEAARGLPVPASGEQATTILQRLAELSGELGTKLHVANGSAELILPDQDAPQ